MNFYKPKIHTCTECNMPLQAEPNVVMGAFSVKKGICRCTFCYDVITIDLTQPQKPKQTL
ncbi:hypothetical protein QQ054_27210 [Oscillatoria amoena NRMC-F 0135]|nr:hypothetical protein [Oscillatoria amoena NRMC-F 0135]